MSLAATVAGGVLLGLNGAASGLFVYETLAMFVVCWVSSKHTQVQVRGTLAEVISARSLGETCKSVFAASRSALHLVKNRCLVAID
jgi:hypothetical protein